MRFFSAFPTIYNKNTREMKNRLQFNRHYALFNTREEALTALRARITDREFIPLIGEPMVFRYKDPDYETNKKVWVILAIGSKSGNNLDERDYHVIDTAELNERIIELSGITGNIQDELDRTQTGAGLEPDGTYSTNTAATYISGATSLKNADDVLDTELARVDEAVKHLVDDVITGVVFDNVTASVVNNTAILNVSADTIPIGPYDEYVGPATVPHRIHDHYTVLDAVKQVDVNFDGLRITKVPAQELGPNIKEAYRLIGKTATNDEGVKGETIYIYKDSSIVEIYLGTSADTVNETTGVIDKKQGDKEFLNYVYYTVNGEYRMTKIDLEDFLTEPEFKSGVTVTNHIAHGVVDPSSESFLTVGADGFKLNGVQDAINSAVAIEASRAETVEEALQAELDNTQTGAGLAADGSYIHDHQTDYIGNATSLADADHKLDVALKKVSDDATASANTMNSAIETEKNRAIGAENALSASVVSEIARVIAAENSISGSVNALSSATISEINRAVSAETALDGRIRNLENTTVTGENAIDVESTELNKKVTLVIDSSDNVLSQSRGGLKTTLRLNYDSNNSKVQLLGNGGTVISEFDSSDFIKDGMIESVTFDPATNILLIVWNTAAGHDSTRIDLSGLVDVYTVAPESGMYMEINDYVVKLNVDVTNGLASYNYARNISGAVVTEKERAIGVENEIKNNFNSFSSATQTSITNLNNALTTEIANRISGDTYLDGKIQNEITRATGAENSLNTKIESETTRATTAENSLNTKIEAEITRATGRENSLSTSITTAVNDLTAAYTEADNNIVTAYTQADQAIVDAYIAAIAQESESRIDTDNMLLSLINGATGDITNLETRLNNEISRATNTENLISGSVINVNNNVSNLGGQLSTFSSNTVNEINNINNRINNLDSKTISGENAIKTNVSGSDTKVSLLINGSDKVLSQDNSGLYTQLSIELSNDGKALYLKGKNGATISTIDTTSFVKDGMLDNVVFDGNSKTLKFTFNTDSGKQQIDVPLGSLVDIYTVSATSASYMIIDNYKIGLNVDVTNGLASYSALRDVDNRLNYLSGTVQTIDGRVTENTTKINNLSGVVQTIDGRVTENTTKINNLSGSVINLSASVVTNKTNIELLSASTVNIKNIVDALSGNVVENRNLINNISANTYNKTEINNLISGASQMKYTTSSTLANLTLSEFLTVAKIAGDTTLSIATTGLPSLPANGVAERHVIIENTGTTDAVVTVSSDSRIKFTLGNRIAIDRNGGIGELNALITYDGSSYTIYVITI